MEAKDTGMNWNEVKVTARKGVKVAVCGGCPILQMGVTGSTG
jgi:hypothetical protein